MSIDLENVITLSLTQGDMQKVLSRYLTEHLFEAGVFTVSKVDADGGLGSGFKVTGKFEPTNVGGVIRGDLKP